LSGGLAVDCWHDRLLGHHELRPSFYPLLKNEFVISFLLLAEQVSSAAVSWCRFEAFVSKPDDVHVSDGSGLTPPPLVVLALTLRTTPHPRAHHNEITTAACLIHRNFRLDCSAPKPVYQSHFCAVSPPADCVFPFDFRDQVAGKSSAAVSMQVEMVSGERSLINYIIAKLHKVSRVITLVPFIFLLWWPFVTHIVYARN